MQFTQVITILSAFAASAVAAPLEPRTTTQLTLALGQTCSSVTSALPLTTVTDTICYAISDLVSIKIDVKNKNIVSYASPACDPSTQQGVTAFLSGVCAKVPNVKVDAGFDVFAVVTTY